MMFWYSSNVTDESSVFLRATFILRLGVRAWVAAAISAKAMKRMVSGYAVGLCGGLTRSLQQFLSDVWQLV